MLALSLNTLTIRSNGRLVAIQVTREMFEETGTSATETDGFVNYPRGIDGAEVAILFREMDSGQVNVSLRSRGKQNVAEFAQLYDGGGHQNAAAFRCQGPFAEVVEKILAAAEKFIAGGEQ